MANTAAAFGLPELVNRLQARIQDDQSLLMEVVSRWAEGTQNQPLSDLDEWVPVEDVEAKSGGKFRTGQVRWLVRDRENNGTADAFKKIGRRLFVNIPLLFKLASGGGSESEKKPA